jgi:hypothetical protein
LRNVAILADSSVIVKYDVAEMVEIKASTSPSGVGERYAGCDFHGFPPKVERNEHRLFDARWQRTPVNG